MKIKYLFIIAAIIVVSSVNTKQASASVVNFPDSGVIVDMGEVAIGQTGTISGAGAGGAGPIFLNVINGTLPAGSMVSFSYSFDGAFAPEASFLEATGSYSYEEGGQLFEGFAIDTDGNGPNASFATGTVDGVTSLSLALASAQISGPGSVTTIITNFSAGLLDFTSLLLGVAIGSTAFSISYEVSAVPLPAALPMFGLSLAALFGFRRKKKATVAVAA